MTRSVCRVCDADTRGFLCAPCLSEVERDLGDMRSLLHELSVTATGQARTYHASQAAVVDQDVAEVDEAIAWQQTATAPRMRTPHARIALPSTRLMVNLPARELFDEAWNTLGTLARDLAETRAVDAPGNATLLSWLVTYCESIRWDEAAADMHRSVTSLHRRLERAVDRRPSRVFAGLCHAPTPAGRCLAALYAWPGSDTVTCDGWRPFGAEAPDLPVAPCGTEHVTAEHREQMIAELDDALLPLAMWQDALPHLYGTLQWPHRTTWARWARRLQVRTVIDGEPYYRGGDVVDLAIRDQARIVGNRNGQRGKKAS